MSKITEYTSASTFDANDVLLKDGENGTMIISVEDAASEFKRLGGIDDDISGITQTITQAMDTIDSSIAGVETDYIASKDYAIGDLFIVNNVLYKATAAIAEEGVIDTEINCAVVNLGDEIGDIRDILGNKANADGSYSTLTAGNAEQLVGTVFTEDDAAYTFRTSGGSADIGDREYDEIVGGSIVWNQYAPAIDNWHYIQETSSGSLIDDGYVFQVTSGNNIGINAANTYGSVKKDHVYVRIFEFKPLEEFAANCFLYWPAHFQRTVNTFISGTAVGSWGTAIAIAKATDNKEHYQMSINLGSTGSTNDHLNKQITVRRPQVFDLTQMFGSEIADYIYNLEQTTPGAGVAWFRKYFPKDYYEYNAGELMHVSDLQSHDMVGFNQLDESVLLGITGIVKSGDEYTSSAQALQKHTQTPGWEGIRYIEGMSYCVSCEVTKVEATNTYLRIYHTDGTYVVSTPVASGNTGKISVTSSPGKTVKVVNITYGSSASENKTSFKNLCINLSWSGWRDGEYEPYVKHSYPLDSSLTLRGIPKLSTDGKLYYDGDHYKSDGTVERWYGIVDLGTLDWYYSSTSTTPRFSVTISDCKKVSSWNDIDSLISISKYTRSNNVGLKADAYNEWGVYSGGIYITDSDYTDAASFKTAMSGVYLVYELAEPTTEEAQPFQSPQIVDDFGTEEYVTSSIVPVGHVTKYMANLRDKLQHLPDLADSDGYYMISQTGHDMDLIRFRIPQAPTADGVYTLKATVSGGTPTYTWVNENATETETTEP